MPYHRVAEFDLWRPGYAGAVVEVLQAGTSTLAPIFSDPALTLALANPQTLSTQLQLDGAAYGRFTQPVYVGVPYYLRINQGEQTSVENLPLTSLTGANASAAVAGATRGNFSRTLAEHFDVEVRAENFGTFGASAAANQAILNAAIGAAAAQGGGRVLLPAGNWPFTNWNLPQGVILEGRGQTATTLRSEQTTAVCTIGGSFAGLRSLTLDGVNLNAGSIGVLSIGRIKTVMESVTVKRFASGIVLRGGEAPLFRQLTVDNCGTGLDLRGDRDSLLSNTGGPLRDLLWDQGEVANCSVVGLRLSFEDDPVLRMEMRGIRIAGNLSAVVVNGARDVLFHRCWWGNNTTNLVVTDDADLSRIDENTVQQLTVLHSRINDGELTFNGLCEDVRFDRTDFVNVSFVLAVPFFPILLLDCTEDTQTTATGAVARLMRNSSFKTGEFLGVTTDATPTTAWSQELEPGETVRVNARIVGRQRNGTNWASGALVATYTRPGSELGFGLESATPVVGTIVTGNTSGAIGRVVAIAGAILNLRDIAGAFINSEGLTFSDGKTAVATSTLVPAAASIRNSTTLEYTGASATPSAATFVSGATSGAYARVAGVTGTTAGELVLVAVDGLFVPGEGLTFSNGVTATTAGAVVPADWFFEQPLTKTDFAWNWAANVIGNSAVVQVTGNTSQIVEWVVEVNILRP